MKQVEEMLAIELDVVPQRRHLPALEIGHREQHTNRAELLH